MPLTHCPHCGVRRVHVQRPVGSGLVENLFRCPACSHFEPRAVEPGLIEVEHEYCVHVTAAAAVTVEQLRALRQESVELAHHAPTELRVTLRTTGCVLGPWWKPKAEQVSARLTRVGLRCEVKLGGAPW